MQAEANAKEAATREADARTRMLGLKADDFKAASTLKSRETESHIKPMDASADRENVERAARQFGALAGLALAINQNERGRVLEANPEQAGEL